MERNNNNSSAKNRNLVSEKQYTDQLEIKKKM